MTSSATVPGWITTENDPLKVSQGWPPAPHALYIDGLGNFPSYPATHPAGWPIGEDLTLLGVCQASCRWRGGLQCPIAGCPRRCVGCSRAWPFDEHYRHIGPAKWPSSNRWECNRVKFLGSAGLTPANTVVWESGAQIP